MTKSEFRGYLSIDWDKSLPPDQNLKHHIRNSMSGIVRGHKQMIDCMMRMQAAFDRWDLEIQEWPEPSVPEEEIN